MFDIHRIKPVHGWREFFGEIGIIVIGVFIALSAEQMVELAQWKEQIEAARISLDDQISDNLFAAKERLQFTACSERQLNRLSEIVDKSWEAPKLRPTMVLLRDWASTAWAAAVASGVVAHMPEPLRKNYAAIFGTAEIIRSLNQQEFFLWSDLQTLHRQTVLTDVSRDRLQSDIARLSALNNLIAIASRQMVNLIDAAHIASKVSDLKMLNGEAHQKCLLPDDEHIIGR
ncbi:hypothetical protein [Sphingomonas nostoxanthinifaciens]|uniref:hypothetical protein n=1 Tax=Sphingomonas nostoxanthinifaciens TaxID=2872652 RepID=UPI001CC1F187|nr:hypothetical protein [Sphingomonas nostoxanthinifaciens]UAK25607.1 hypothetical protein K8P63_05510 [Sphingomonas nostoxanthinifaciens]